MKTIGIIGGMSWESSVCYYQILNEEVKLRLQGLHSAKCMLYSVEFEEIEAYQRSGQWEKCGTVIGDAALALEKAGADFILIASNTMHKVIPYFENALHIPILHIADATALELQKQGIHKVALLGTRYTMEEDFYKQKLTEHQIEVLIPNEEDREVINTTIFNELCVGKFTSESKKRFLEIVEKLHDQGAQGAILGCTEIGLLIKQEDTQVPLFDTTRIHAIKAVDEALKD